MLCPTAVDHFFMTKLSQMEINMSKRNKKSYRQRLELEDRRKECAESRMRYPTKILLVIEKHRAEKSLEEIDKIKWLVPQEMTLLQLSSVLKQRLKCPQHQQLFLTINGREFPPLLSPLASLHSQFCDEDGFLYLSYSSQECYG
eukprot:GFUD01127520.1.p1 GENE.GFUD01127520.1~~GFUD01127520.1.p1  ORF type:complete len:165 (+),score=36.54 GFUD01127520.1:66-497(+)